MKEILSKAERHVYICSAWIRGDTLRDLLNDLKDNVRLEVVIRSSSFEDMNTTDPHFFSLITRKGGDIFISKRLHAKFVIVDSKFAVVGSANITRSGLEKGGNFETVVYTEDIQEISALEKTFDLIKEESYKLSDAVALVIDSITSRTGRVILLKELDEHSYVKIPISKGNFLLCRIFDIRSFNPAFGAESISEGGFLKRVFTEKEESWKAAALFAKMAECYEVKEAKVEVLGEYEESKDLFKTPFTPLKAGSPVETLKEEENLKAVLLKNHSGYPMRLPVPVGKLQGTNAEAFLDMEKVISMHMAVVGATGSGKTTFVKKILKELKEPVKVYVFDLYGEYYEDLKRNRNVRKVSIPNVLFPLDSEDMKRIIREGGLILSERSTEEKTVISLFKRYLRPDLNRTVFNTKSFEDILKEAVLLVRDSSLRDLLLETLESLKNSFGKEALRNQSKVVRMLKESLNFKEGIVIYDFKETDIAETSINIAGLLLKEILKISKRDASDKLVVLEEAHNFVPEKGTGDIPAGRENLAYVSAKRIAMEGRKLKLGIVAITQRPAGISKFVFSQLNTRIVFKLISRNDLEAVSPFFEVSREDIFNLLPFLKPGTAYVSGIAVPFSFLFYMEEITSR